MKFNFLLNLSFYRSSLSGKPVSVDDIAIIWHKKKPCIFAELFADRTGLEPATSAVTGQHSNQLNYRSKILLPIPISLCSSGP